MRTADLPVSADVLVFDRASPDWTEGADSAARLATIASLLPHDWELELVDCNVRPVTDKEWA